MAAAISSAFLMAPAIPSEAGVNTSSAPSAINSFLRSILKLSGSVIISLYPKAAAAKAKPTPVFPLVGSMITEF
ncbi:hypothetical protein D3C80_1620470 [compost metagenome]